MAGTRSAGARDRLVVGGSHDLEDRLALDRLVDEQPLGDLVEQVAVGGQQLLGAAVGLLGDRLDLLVARLAQRFRGGQVVAGTWCERIEVPIPYSWTIERAIAVTRLRSSEAPVVTLPKVICSETRPASKTAM